MSLVLIFAAAGFLAYANGANDNFKGVATLYGSGVVSFRTALLWGTTATFAGSLTAAFLGQALIKLFSGSGLVPPEIVAEPAFLLAVLLGASTTVFTTARMGIPISTTHALIGGLTGAGLAAASNAFQFAPLLEKFLIPLAVAPLIPVVVIGLIFPTMRFTLTQLRPLLPYRPHLQAHPLGADIVTPSLTPSLTLQRLRDGVHFLSAGAVSFARGLNDAPKIAGIALAAGALGVNISIFAIALAMALGGLIHARAVAETLSHKITNISHQEGIAANLVTSFLVLFASKFAVPVSTTHVSVGSIFGIGLARRDANTKLITGIVSAWVLTLPAAMLLAAILYFTLSQFPG
jgi:PiT family inorganic phosphate transporter